MNSADEDVLKKDEDLSFEESISQLENLVSKMESGDTPLESLVSHYQTGMKLLRSCRGKIESAELKIQEVSSKVDYGDDSLLKK